MLAPASPLTAPMLISSQFVMMVCCYAIGVQLIELRGVLFVRRVDALLPREMVFQGDWERGSVCTLSLRRHFTRPLAPAAFDTAVGAVPPPCIQGLAEDVSSCRDAQSSTTSGNLRSCNTVCAGALPRNQVFKCRKRKWANIRVSMWSHQSRQVRTSYEAMYIGQLGAFAGPTGSHRGPTLGHTRPAPHMQPLSRTIG
jgi:hypothetical protein